jgi:peroxiredoxin Q/BCP
MKAVVALCVGLAFALVAGSGVAAVQDPGLKVGDLAPSFSLQGSDAKTYSLADYRGVRPVVLAWFPRTPIKD